MEIFEFENLPASTGLYYVRSMETDYRARTYLAEIETGQVVADTADPDTWPAFYDLGWSKSELHAGRLDAWAGEYDAYQRADLIEYMTEEAERTLGWATETVESYFNFGSWATLPSEATWIDILDEINDLEEDEETGVIDDSEIERILGEYLVEMSGQELKATRLALGLSQDALAGLLGVKQPTVNRWERGERVMPSGAVRELRTIVDRFLADVDAGRFDGPWGPVARFWAKHR